MNCTRSSDSEATTTPTIEGQLHQQGFSQVRRDVQVIGRPDGKGVPVLGEDDVKERAIVGTLERSDVPSAVSLSHSRSQYFSPLGMARPTKTYPPSGRMPTELNDTCS
jgi:hypothetical protein